MSIVIGFGKTETDYENTLVAAIREHVATEYCKTDAVWFDATFVASIRTWIETECVAAHQLCDDYMKATTYPDRYSHFWVTVLNDASHIVFILKFHHINRRHAFSPDGWALLRNEQVFYVDEWDAGRSKRGKAA